MNTWFSGVFIIATMNIYEGESQLYDSYFNSNLYNQPTEQKNDHGARRDATQDSYQYSDFARLARLLQESFGRYQKPPMYTRKTGSSYSTIDDGNSYSDYETSHTVNLLGPHQVETIQSEHYSKKVPSFDTSDFHHEHEEKHAEVHYHQHKHIHKHNHKQEHVHQHKNQHQHKHAHHQDHKHAHHEDHKHGHDHKHDHHQGHKHDHHHEHKHGHHQDHKHDHHHGHKHQHNVHAKHEHGHKYEHGY
ncbi:hypothetical protein FQR65_LT05428 [Abscondita terminalis]|nr:hypothetical protein FQR65_LT05428 [Abscondita terminalis]